MTTKIKNTHAHRRTLTNQVHERNPCVVYYNTQYGGQGGVTVCCHVPGMVMVPSCSRVSGLILMADVLWLLLISRYNRQPCTHTINLFFIIYTLLLGLHLSQFVPKATQTKPSEFECIVQRNTNSASSNFLLGVDVYSFLIP